MQVEVEDTPSAARVVRLSGEIDLVQAPRLRSALVAAGEPQLMVIDLREVSFIDSSGLGVLVGRLRAARQAGRDIRLVMAPGRVLRSFEITGLQRIFEVHDDVESACDTSESA